MLPIIIGFAVILVIAIIIYVWKMNPAADSQQQAVYQPPAAYPPSYQQSSAPYQQPSYQPAAQTPSYQQPSYQPAAQYTPPAPAVQPISSLPSVQPVPTLPPMQPIAAPPAVTTLPYVPPVVYPEEPAVPVVPVVPVVPAVPTQDPSTLTKYVKISKSSTKHKNDDDSFQIAEIILKSDDVFISPSDIQSVTSSTSAYGSNPNMVIDGKTDGNYFANTTWHSDNTSQPRWIMITLTKPIKISYVKIYNRTDCCWERLSGAVLELINQDNKVIKSVTLNNFRVQDLTF